MSLSTQVTLIDSQTAATAAKPVNNSLTTYSIQDLVSQQTLVEDTTSVMVNVSLAGWKSVGTTAGVESTAMTPFWTVQGAWTATQTSAKIWWSVEKGGS